MEKIGEVRTDFYHVVWLMSGDNLVLEHKGKKTQIRDGDIKTRSIGGFCVDGEIIGMPEREIKVPEYVLTRRDERRKWRVKEQRERLYIPIGENFTNEGSTNFFMFYDVFIVEFENQTTQIKDDQITKKGDKFFISGTLFPESRIHQIEIPVNILEKRDEKRRQYEISKMFKPIVRTNTADGIIDFYLCNTGELLIKRNGKEAVVTHIETIYGKRAVKVEELELGHPYLELPAIVETAFMDMQKKLELVDLKLISVGKSLLDGRLFYKLTVELPSGEWNKVKSFFVDFGNDSELKGMLTSVPEKVASTLGIKFEKIEA